MTYLTLCKISLYINLLIGEAHIGYSSMCSLLCLFVGEFETFQAKLQFIQACYEENNSFAKQKVFQMPRERTSSEKCG